MAAVVAHIPQIMAWAYDRPDGGRGFGFTGFHVFANLANDNFRTTLLNGVAWVSGLEVPADGVQSTTLSKDELEHLMDEASTRGAEGDAEGHLALAAIGLGEEQICDVGAGDAQNEESNDHQDDEEGDDRGAVAWRKRSGLFETELKVFFRGGVGFGEVFGQGGQLGGGLIACDAGFESSGNCDPVKETGGAIGEGGDKLLDIAEGDPELGVEEEIDAAKGGRGHADDGVGASGESDGFAEDVGVGGEAMLPETVAEDDDG